MKRIVTALLLIPTITWTILGAPDVVFLAVLAATGLLAYREFDRIVAAHGTLPAGWPGMAAGVVLLLVPQPAAAIVLAAMLGMALAMRASNLRASLSSAAAFVLGIVYIFGAWRCVAELRLIDRHWAMFALLLGWAGDTAALCVGRAMGRHKMAPRVSPAKTWEGAAGSVAGSVLAGTVYAHYLIPAAPLGWVLALSCAGNIAGQLGDLSESALKRGAGLKDSGTMLPGHGGWLDRIDASLFSAPAVYAMLMWFRL